MIPPKLSRLLVPYVMRYQTSHPVLVVAQGSGNVIRYVLAATAVAFLHGVLSRIGSGLLFVSLGPRCSFSPSLYPTRQAQTNEMETCR